ncbi:peroxidase 27-like [Amaranthus tricolor]|uniref:peroxidase 27-like n=1 Tax=Amaranthus tricolor TaxID=29722 RepID=UPI00258D9C4A|nr:peroxidase 27-like [Amaranthus tricolor]
MNKSKNNHIIIRLIQYILQLAILVKDLHPLCSIPLEGDGDDFAPCIESPEIVLSRVDDSLNHCQIVPGSCEYCHCRMSSDQLKDIWLTFLSTLFDNYHFYIRSLQVETIIHNTLILFSLILNLTNGQCLKVGFYEKSCPLAEAITRNVIKQTLALAPSLSGPLLRMFHHDCFVRGCDASVFLDSPTQQTKKDAIPNKILRGSEVIDRVESELEMYYSGIVSCADIIVLISRNVVVRYSGSSWNVETGRRDGVVSSLNEALANLPPPFANITSLKTNFQQRGLSHKDLVVLSGAHTIGIAQCSSFINRLYNFSGQGDNNSFDPTMDPNYVVELRMKCMKNGPNNLVDMDLGSSNIFDAHYYDLVSKNRGLFQSDAALLDDGETNIYVQTHKGGNPASFFKDFGVSMVNMGRIGVHTGTAGQIRKVCSKVN